jgi:hypothetical protein
LILLFQLTPASSSVCDEDLILHKAVGILHKHIGDLVIESSEYTSPTDTSLRHSLNVMPPVLKTPLLTLNNDSITKVFLQLLLKPIRCVTFAHIFREERYKFLQWVNTKPLNTTEKCTKFCRKIEPNVLSVLWNKYQTEK